MKSLKKKTTRARISYYPGSDEEPGRKPTRNLATTGVSDSEAARAAWTPEQKEKINKIYQKAADERVFLSILSSLLQDVERLRPGTKGLDRDYVTLEARVKGEGIAFLGTALCTLGKALDKGLEEGTFTCPVGFKRRRGSKIPLLFGGIFCGIFDVTTGDIKECDLMEDVKILRQLLYFLEKVSAGFLSINKTREEDRSRLCSDGSDCWGPSPVSIGSRHPRSEFNFGDTRQFHRVERATRARSRCRKI